MAAASQRAHDADDQTHPAPGTRHPDTRVMLMIRRIRFAMVAAAVLVIGWFIWQARGALIPFIVGGVLAYMLSPLVERLARVMPYHRTRRELARILAIAIVYITGFGVLFGAGALIVPA